MRKRRRRKNLREYRHRNKTDFHGFNSDISTSSLRVWVRVRNLIFHIIPILRISRSMSCIHVISELLDIEIVNTLQTKVVGVKDGQRVKLDNLGLVSLFPMSALSFMRIFHIHLSVSLDWVSRPFCIISRKITILLGDVAWQPGSESIKERIRNF